MGTVGPSEHGSTSGGRRRRIAGVAAGCRCVRTASGDPRPRQPGRHAHPVGLARPAPCAARPPPQDTPGRVRALDRAPRYRGNRRCTGALEAWFTEYSGDIRVTVTCGSVSVQLDVTRAQTAEVFRDLRELLGPPPPDWFGA